MTEQDYKTFLLDLSDKLEQLAVSYEAYSFFMDGLNYNKPLPKDLSGFCFLLDSVTNDLRLSIESIRNIET